MLIRPHDSYAKKQFILDIGVSEHQDPKLPLPNQAPSTEGDFWSWRASENFPIEAYAGQIHDERGWATLLIYYLGQSGGHTLIGGGFGVLIRRNYPAPTEVEYVTWTPCVHQMSQRNVGNCLNEYVCKKCDRGYTVDSSG